MQTLSDPAFINSLLIFIILVSLFFLVERVIVKNYIERRTRRLKKGHDQAHLSPHEIAKAAGENSPLMELGAKIGGKIFDLNKNIGDAMRTSFEQCGFSPQTAPIVIPLFRALFTLGAIGAYFVVSLSIPALGDQPPFVRYAIFGLFVFIGYRSLDYGLDFIKKNRYAKIQGFIPNSIDLLVSCAKGGLNIEKSFERLAKEMAFDTPDLAKEFAITSAELSLLPDRRVAYNNLMRRVALPLMHTLCVTLIQAEDQGVSVGQSLHVISQEFTKKKLIEIETKAARLPVLLTVPILLFSLPSLMIIIMGPAISNFSNSAFFNQ